MHDDIKRKTAEVWGASPAGTTYGEGHEKGTKEFFDSVCRRRSSEELPWLPDTVNFDSFSGKIILEIGCGAGYDAFAFCRSGADYFGIDITPANPVLTRKHLGYFGYEPHVSVADAENLPFPDNSFDAAYSFGVLHHTPDIEKSFKEVSRVLKPGGSFQVYVYHRNSIYYRLSLWLANHILRMGFREMDMTERLSRIEFTTGDELPLVNVYSRKELDKLLTGTGLVVTSICVRKLLHVDLPDIPIANRLYRFIPGTWLDLIGRRYGWYLAAKAQKKGGVH